MLNIFTNLQLQFTVTPTYYLLFRPRCLTKAAQSHDGNRLDLETQNCRTAQTLNRPTKLDSNASRRVMAADDWKCMLRIK